MALPDRKTVLSGVTRRIASQLEEPEAVQELKALGPKGYDWNGRVREAIDRFLPVMVEIAPALATECVARFNCPADLNEILNADIPESIMAECALHNSALAEKAKEWLRKCRQMAITCASAMPNIESQQISAEVQRFLLSDRAFGNKIRLNGASIYPDVILADFDYSFLPFQSGKAPVEGPCLKGRDAPKPSNVPDGCEIKTNQGFSVKVDAHGAHPGLHMCITWGFEKGRIVIRDVLAAYIRVKDYSISDGRVDVTTKKRSFGQSHFISLLRGQA